MTPATPMAPSRLYPASAWRTFAGLVVLVALPGWVGSLRSAESDDVRERRVRAHTTFLADDLLEGRAAGTRGHELAMAYVSAQFRRLGLEPAGTDGYLEPLALRESRLDRDSGRLVIHHGSKTTTLANVTEVLVRPAAGEARGEVRAPAVFVGFGISAPEFGYDDFAGGVDVRGRIAVVLAGSPAKLPATARAHYTRMKTDELARRGAVGFVSLETPTEERRLPWAIAVDRGRFPTMRLIESDGTLFEAYPEIRASASASRAAAAAFFAHAPRTIAEVFTTAERSEPQAFALDIEVSLAGAAEVGDTSSANVLAWLPGTDAALTGEPLVVTAHLDHLGLGAPVDGDGIYNGALDNAIGIAVILAVAEELAAGPRMARPVLFAALTAEEKGLLGAYRLARHPPSRVRRFAANLNIDMPVLLAPVRDVIGLGAEHSTLGGKLTEAAARQGFTVSPDPQPDEVIFVRSDQYPFVRAGIPALYLKLGFKGPPGGPDLAALEQDFRRNRYHRPADDLAQPIHWSSAAALARLSADVARSIAGDRESPRWNAGDFFGTRFGPERGTPAPQR